MDKDIQKFSFTQRLNQAMEDAGMNAAELCRICSISKSTMSQYRSGKYIPKYDRIIPLAKALGCSPDWLFGKDAPKLPSTADGEAMGSVPILDIQRIRSGTIFSPETILGQESVDARYCEGCHFVLIANDSMYPAIIAGDHVLCVQQNYLENGQTGVVILSDGRTVFRRLENGRLTCGNPFLPPTEDDPSQTAVIGRVVRTTRHW